MVLSLMVKDLKSWFKSSWEVRPMRLVPALNISMANFSTSMLAISAKRSSILLSVSVEVGDFISKVSDIMAAAKSPAIFLVGLLPFSK